MTDTPPPPPPGYGAPPPPPVPAPAPVPGIGGPYHPNQEECTMGMLVHLLALFVGILGPLILWLVKRETSAFIDHQGKEAVNFQLTVLIASVGLSIIAFLVAIPTLGIGLFFMMPLFFVIAIGALVLVIMAAVKASRGEWTCYPCCIRFIK